MWSHVKYIYKTKKVDQVSFNSFCLNEPSNSFHSYPKSNSKSINFKVLQLTFTSFANFYSPRLISLSYLIINNKPSNWWQIHTSEKIVSISCHLQIQHTNIKRLVHLSFIEKKLLHHPSLKVNILYQEIYMGQSLYTFKIHQNLKHSCLPPNRKFLLYLYSR